nr:ATP synthase CF0 subunit I [Christisonia kwangtungensis]
MNNVTDSFVDLVYWLSYGSVGFNTDIFSTNLINLCVVLGVLIFFGKGVCVSCLFQKKLSDLLNKRKYRILNTIQNSEEFHAGTIKQLEKAKARLRKVKMETNQFRVNGYSEIEREKSNFINYTYKTLKYLENYKKETIQFEQQESINQVRQRVFQQSLKITIETLNRCLTTELHLRNISVNIIMLGMMKEITD